MLTSGFLTGQKTVQWKTGPRIPNPRFAATVLSPFLLATDQEWYTVPGLADNKELGIRKNKMTLPGTTVKAIFEPVVNEVLKLVTGQIEAVKRPVKAVVLVGGFGQNAYLRDTIRDKLKSSNVEVMQSPNR